MSEDLFNAVLTAWSTLSSESDFTKLLEGITQISKTLSGASHASIAIVEGKKLRLAYSTEMDTETASKFSIPIGEGFIGKVAQTREALRIKINQPTSELSSNDSVIKASSVLCVPMLLRKEIFGTIQVYNKKNAEEFSTDDESRLQLFANQAAIAIERFQLHSRLLQESRRVHGIFEALTDGIMVVDADGNPILYNKAVETLFFPDGKQNYALTTYLSTILQREHPTDSTEVFLLKPHSLILSNRIVVVKDPQGKPQEIIISIRNITDQTGIDRKYSQFYAIMLRLSKKLSRQISTAKGKKKSLLVKKDKDILRNLVYLTDLKSGPLRIEKEPSPILEIYREIKQKFEKQLKKKKIEILDAHLWEIENPIVRLEPSRFKQLFSIIFKKANNFLPTNGSGEIRFKAFIAQTKIFFEVLYVGKDIEKKICPQILDWKSQIDKVISGDTKEIDFDLAYARHIIQAHKGTLAVSSPQPHQALVQFDVFIE